MSTTTVPAWLASTAPSSAPTGSTSPAWKSGRIDAAATRWSILTLDDPVPPAVFDEIKAAVKPNKAYKVSL